MSLLIVQWAGELTGGRAKAGVRLTAVASTVMASPVMGEKSDYESLESLSSRAIRASESVNTNNQTNPTMTTLTEDLVNNARSLADYVKEIASAKSESRDRQRKLTVGHDPRSVATRPQSIANMSHAKKGIISTNETDRAVSVGGRRENQLVRVLLGRWMFCRWHDGEGNCLPIWRLGFLLQLEDNRLRRHWKSIRKLSRVLRHIHRHLRDGKTPGAHAQEWVAYLQTLPDTGDQKRAGRGAKMMPTNKLSKLRFWRSLDEGEGGMEERMGDLSRNLSVSVGLPRYCTTKMTYEKG
ncbi:uncharacterized protein CLUP02_12749 [Colletotrichum lupini]|uniref:Uncharacterized protein n=1 Tax=Colletotrichum lupini TaxID=145971 RepID=A0A9Q8WL42_9PEZI|nr:uncharacterized protein CLUP02_12749 [Colletotrichum lupini]UQC87246.1 hypothetical protein CLUP02_12749 [Colletotrichum lupini]